MRFHVISLPHTHTTEEYSVCAYTEKVRKFCIMMKNLGHTVFLYAGEYNEAPCDEHITCIYEWERRKVVGDRHYVHAPFDVTMPHWVHFNNTAIDEMGKRIQPKDFICVIAGQCHKPIADAFPNNMTVEFGIGYSGVFGPYKVFESYAWMHTVYGQLYGAANANGNWYDTVINGYLEIEKFPFEDRKDDYFLYVGRLVDRKGFNIAAEVCEKMGKRLIIAGEGTPPKYGEYVGVVNPTECRRLMSKAKALFVPTIYIEPFANVHVEAMACGTPVITSDWGVFTETVTNGYNGFRCRTFREFCEATEKVNDLLPSQIRGYAEDNFSLEVIGLKYQAYFEKLLTLWDKGWYT